LLGTWLKKGDQAHYDSAEKVFTAFDNDPAGQEMLERAVDDTAANGRIRVVGI